MSRRAGRGCVRVGNQGESLLVIHMFGGELPECVSLRLPKNTRTEVQSVYDACHSKYQISDGVFSMASEGNIQQHSVAAGINTEATAERFRSVTGLRVLWRPCDRIRGFFHEEEGGCNEKSCRNGFLFRGAGGRKTLPPGPRYRRNYSLHLLRRKRFVKTRLPFVIVENFVAKGSLKRRGCPLI